MKIKTKDKIVQQVLRKMDERSIIGQEKYGSTMHDEVSTNKKDLRDFLIDVQEELMDALLYIEASRACLQEEIEECYINDKYEPVIGCEDVCDPEEFCECESERRMKHIGQNGNDGLHYGKNYITDEDGSGAVNYSISAYPESNVTINYDVVSGK